LSDSREKKLVPEWVNCQHSVELLNEYLDGTLPPEERRALERHFKACPPCLDFMRKYQATPSLCKRALVEQVPEDLGRRLTQFLHAKLRQS
jgi:anti-sigma factor (TIGR02949 family)